MYDARKAKEIIQKEVDPFLDTWPSVTLTAKEVKKIKEWAEWAEQKAIHKLTSGEPDHVRDGRQEVKRNITGQSGEVALERYLGINFVEWDIGSSKDFAHPDIGALYAGVKTVEYGKLPLVFKDSYYPEVICIKKDNTIYFAGVLFPLLIKQYHDDSLVADANILSVNKKTCFYGLSHLKPLANFVSARAI